MEKYSKVERQLPKWSVSRSVAKCHLAADLWGWNKGEKVQVFLTDRQAGKFVAWEMSLVEAKKLTIPLLLADDEKFVRSIQRQVEASLLPRTLGAAA